jgi:hypothetical protein
MINTQHKNENPASKHSQRSQLRNIDSKRLVKKIVHLDAGILAAIKNRGEPREFRLASFP